MPYDLPGIGDNVQARFAETVIDRLELDYGEFLRGTAEAIAGADELPQTVESSIDVAEISGVVVKLRDLAARAEAHRVAEKEPYLRAGEAVHTFFKKRVIDPLDVKRRQLTSRLDAYKQHQLAEERAKREAEAAAARKAAAEAHRLREEAEAMARRARSIESSEKKAAEAADARVMADMAAVNAEEKMLAAQASAGQIVGERFEGPDRSGQVTMRKQPVVFIENTEELDLEKLRPFIKEEHLLMALRAWAKATNYNERMPGATVALRDTTVVR